MIDYEVNFRNKKTGVLIHTTTVSIKEEDFSRISVILKGASQLRDKGLNIPPMNKVDASYSII